jgi:hypothetical protein
LDRVGKFCTELENVLQSFNALDSVGMLSTELEYLYTQLEGFLQGWNAFDSVGIPLNTVEMLSEGLE